MWVLASSLLSAIALQIQVRQSALQLSIRCLVQGSTFALEPTCKFRSLFECWSVKLDSNLPFNCLVRCSSWDLEPTCKANMCSAAGESNWSPTLNSSAGSTAVPENWNLFAFRKFVKYRCTPATRVVQSLNVFQFLLFSLA